MLNELLLNEGYNLTASTDELDILLEGVCTPNQRKRLRKIWCISNDKKRLEAVYGFPSTLQQAHLLFSHDRERIQVSYEWLVNSLSGSERRIADLGCGSGTLARIIALRNPHASVIGLDLASNLIRVAGMAKNPRNVSFRVANIERLAAIGSFDALVTACGVEVPFHAEPVWSDFEDFENGFVPSAYKVIVKRAYARMLAGMRAAAEEGARFWGVFRIPTRLKFAVRRQHSWDRTGGLFGSIGLMTLHS